MAGFNLVLIDTKTHQVKVLDGRKVLLSNTFNTYLDRDQVESIRKDPQGFLASINAAVN